MPLLRLMHAAALSLFVVMPLYAVAVGTVTARLRAARRIVCRDAVRYAYAAHIVGNVAWCTLGLTLGRPFPPLPTIISVSAGLIFACDTYCYLGDRAVHRHHEVDCQYGPPRCRDRRRVRLTLARIEPVAA